MGVSAVDYGYERVIVHIAKGRIEREIRVETGQRLRGKNGAEREFALAFLEEAQELVAANGVPSAGMQANQEGGVVGILNAAGVGVDVIFGAEDGRGNREHGVFDAEDGFFPGLFQRGQDEAVLAAAYPGEPHFEGG